MLTKVALTAAVLCVVARGCATDFDCSLSGVCNEAGACVCDAGWRGAACSELNLAPADPRDGVIAWPTSSWGGVAIRDPVDDNSSTSFTPVFSAAAGCFAG